MGLFQRHQRGLLWLLNTSLIGRWFRWVLRIHGSRSAVGRQRITGILPHAIQWADGERYVAEFRTHQKFAKRLYYAFAPLWWAMHAWDWAVADRWTPRLSFGFDTLTVYPDPDAETTSVDGRVWQTSSPPGGGTWASVRDGAGTDADDAATQGSVMIHAGTTSNLWQQIDRRIDLFDTSALTAGATISAGVLSLSGNWNSEHTLGASPVPDIDIYTSAPASNTAIVGADFDSLGTTSQTGAPIAFGSWANSEFGTYNAFTFDATGRGNISKTSISKFGARNGNYDVANTAPTWSSNNRIRFDIFSADNTGTAADPKLVVTYTLPGGSPFVTVQFRGA